MKITSIKLNSQCLTVTYYLSWLRVAEGISKLNAPITVISWLWTDEQWLCSPSIAPLHVDKICGYWTEYEEVQTLTVTPLWY